MPLPYTEEMCLSLVEELISFCSELRLCLPTVSTGGGVLKNKTTKLKMLWIVCDIGSKSL